MRDRYQTVTEVRLKADRPRGRWEVRLSKDCNVIENWPTAIAIIGVVFAIAWALIEINFCSGTIKWLNETEKKFRAEMEKHK